MQINLLSIHVSLFVASKVKYTFSDDEDKSNDDDDGNLRTIITLSKDDDTDMDDSAMKPSDDESPSYDWDEVMKINSDGEKKLKLKVRKPAGAEVKKKPPVKQPFAKQFSQGNTDSDTSLHMSK